MIIKCKMCGGDMELSADQRTGTCEYCGSTMTLPKVDDDQRAAAFNRGNHFRRIGEFDKALSVYESIVREDDKDAEAHWCCALCRFGIEYVKDPASGEYLPTCHRASFDSFLEDVDYQAALEHADVVARRQYEKDAETIAQVQRGILSISQKEKPFDVFICYKESDENGNRTVDSTLAQDIYYQLTEQGRRVFFARITLEDKAGQEYEPYIFAALHSAKVMVVVGTKPEYLNAVWVKNEWSRYLSLMKNDRKRLLIPCYRDMDPYDLPEQLSVLQSYDMGKIGFIQDLIRGIAKVLDADKKPEEKVIERVIEHGTGGAAPGIESLMQRAYLFMEDGDFQNADEYLNRVLDIDPNYAPAYAARTCTALRFRRERELEKATFLYSDNPDWKKALRFADEKQKEIYEHYEQETVERVKRQIRDYTYDCAIELAVIPALSENPAESLKRYMASCAETDPKKRCNGRRRANHEENEAAFLKAVSDNEPGKITEEAYKAAADMFEINVKAGGENGDTVFSERAKQCRVLAEQARQKKMYINASDHLKTGKQSRDVRGLLETAKVFKSIPDYKDALQKEEECRKEAAAIREEDYQKALEAVKSAGAESRKWQEALNLLKAENLNGYRDVEELRKQAEEKYQQTLAKEERLKKQQTKKKAIIAGVTASVAIICIGIYTTVISPLLEYKGAEKLLAAGEYDAAVEAFTALGDYSDAADRILEVKYKEAESLLDTEGYVKAMEAFAALGEYSEAAERLKEIESSAIIGDTITFGNYEQDSNSAEKIEWIVLDQKGNQALVLSKYALDAVPYHEEWEDVTWEESTIRTWLNSTFMDTAFSAEEQAAIQTVTVDNSEGQGYSGYDTYGGNDTEDKVFLLSYKEAFEDYFTDDDSRICQPTAYAESEGAYVDDDNGNCYWWLRSPGSYQRSAACVSPSGGRIRYDVCYDGSGVRPALWINLESGIF